MSQKFRQATDLLFSREKPWRRPLLVYRLLISPSKKYPPLGKIVLRYDRKLRSLVKSYPELAPRYLNQLKRISSKKKTHTLAVTFAEEQPNNAELMVYLANYWYGEKAAKRGDELLSRAKELAPNLPLIYEEEAASQQWRNNFSRELDALNQLVTLYQEGSSEFTITMNRLAFLRYRMRDYIAADQIYTQYLLPEFSVKGILAALRCAQVLAKEDRVKELETLLMLQQSNDLELPIHLAREYIKLQDYLACSFMLEQAEAEGLADTEDFVQTKIQLAWLENRWDDALKVVQDALAHFKTLPNNSYLDYVEIAIALGDIETALQILDRCAPDGEADFHISYRKGMLLREKGCFKEAWESFAAAGTTLAISEDAEPPFSRVLSTALLDTANNETSQYLHSVSRRRNIAFQSYMLAKHHAAQGEFQTACDLAVRMSNAKVSGFPRFRSSFSFRAREARNAFEHFSEIVETLPIDESLVVYESFHGASTSCNPLALCLYALETPELAHLRHVWIIKPGSPIDDRLANDPRVSFVSRGSEGSLLALGTAAYVINNTSLPGWYFRRLGQRYLNTWHGIPWKHLGKKVTSEPFAYGNIARNMLNASHVIAPDQHTLDALLSDQNVGRLVSPANTKITGYPRTDLTLNITKNRQEEIRRLLGVRPDQQVVLYAPTWRGNVDDISEDLSFFNETVLQLQRSDVFLAIRAHHFMEAQFQSHTGLPGTVVPSSVNSNELLGIVDVLVTDYSSIMFDFLPTGRPLIKYIPDFQDYQSTRGMYFTPEEVPGTTVTEAHDLASALNQALLDGESKEHHEAFRTFFTHEDGQAAARVWEFLLAPLPLAPQAHTNKALFFTNSFNPNGITRSLANAVRYLSTTEITPFIAIPHSAVEYADEALLQEVASHSTILLLHGGYSGTQLQNWVRGHLLQGKAQPNTRMQTIIAEGAAYEVRRRFGESRFNTAIDFDGYSPQLTMFVAGQKPALADRNLHWLHSMMLEEQQLKFPWLAAAFPWYGNFDALVSVSEGAMFQNSKELAAAFNVPQEGHITVENLLVPQRVLALSKEPLSTTASAWLKGDERTILTVGRFAPEKNQDSLVEAIALIKDELEGLKFGFVGEGPQEAYIRKKVKDLGLEDIITFLGYEKNPYPLMSSVDLVLQASLHEGQGLALLEALTLNIPVYASDIPPFRSVLEDGVYGHLFDPSPEGIAEALRKFASGEQHQVKPFDANQYEYSAQEKLLRVLSSAAPSEERS